MKIFGETAQKDMSEPHDKVHNGFWQNIITGHRKN